jgi:hypothetical protein
VAAGAAVKLRVLVLVVIVALGGCRNQPLNPPRLVLDTETDASIQLFVQATILMMRSYGFDTIAYEDIQARSASAGFRTIPFMPPDTIRGSPRLVASLSGSPTMTPDNFLAAAQSLGTKPFVKYYIRTGLRAAQLICRNHLTRLDEGNQYLEFLQKELGVASSFASGILALVNANGTLTKSFLITVTGVNAGLDAFQEYRYLSIDRDAARILVETAQNKLAEYYLNQVDLTDNTDAIKKNLVSINNAAGGYTFSDALNAVSVIEYQCTREGIRYLLNRSINNTPSNMEIDAATGTVLFKSASNNRDGTGVAAAAVISNSTRRLQPIDPSPPFPRPGDTSLNSFEAKLKPAVIQVWQAFVCVTPQDGMLGSPGSPTRKAISKFVKRSATESDAITPRDEVLLRRGIRDKAKNC